MCVCGRESGVMGGCCYVVDVDDDDDGWVLLLLLLLLPPLLSSCFLCVYVWGLGVPVAPTHLLEEGKFSGDGCIESTPLSLSL